MRADCKDLVSRYWQAVRSDLQDPQADRIVEELSGAMWLELADQEEELGRDLTEDEVVARLKAEKHPLVVAAEQGPQISLIGPLLYPSYLRLLKWIGIASLVWLVVLGGFAIFVPSIQVKHPGLQYVEALRPAWEFAFSSFALLTAVFALLDRWKAKALGEWDPRKLPAVRTEAEVPRSSSLISLILNSILLLWWVGVFRAPTVAGWKVLLTPEVTRPFFWPIFGMLLVLVVVSAASILWPWRSRPLAGICLGIDLLGLILLFLVLLTGFQLPTLVEVKAPSSSPGDVAVVSRLMSVAALSAAMVGEVFFAYGIYQNARRIFRRSPHTLAP